MNCGIPISAVLPNMSAVNPLQIRDHPCTDGPVSKGSVAYEQYIIWDAAVALLLQKKLPPFCYAGDSRRLSYIAEKWSTRAPPFCPRRDKFPQKVGGAALRLGGNLIENRLRSFLSTAIARHVRFRLGNRHEFDCHSKRVAFWRILTSYKQKHLFKLLEAIKHIPSICPITVVLGLWINQVINQTNFQRVSL